MPEFGGNFGGDRYTCGECGDPAPWGNGLCSRCRSAIEKVYEDHYGDYDDEDAED